MRPTEEFSQLLKRDLSIVIPFYNEQGNVARLMERLFKVLDGMPESKEVIAVDDGSSDGTLDLLRWEATSRPDLRIVSLDPNRGQHRAILEGFRKCRGQWVITLDADLQNPPEEIPRVLNALIEGHDKVGTFRQNRRDPLFRKVSSRAVNLVARRISGIRIKDFGCMLRGYSQEVIQKIIAEDDRFQSENPNANPGTPRRLYLPARGYRHAENPVELPVQHEARTDGESKYNLPRLIDLSLDLMASSKKK